MKCGREDFEQMAYLPRNLFFASALRIGMTGGTQQEVWEALEPTVEDAMNMAHDEFENQPDGVDLDYWLWFRDAIVLLYENINVRNEDWSRGMESVSAFGRKVCMFPLPPLHGYPAPTAKLVFEGNGIVSIHPDDVLGEDDFTGPYEFTEGSERTGPAVNWKEQN